jgi:8-oxo-dGTP pyrophosphatase MutT (NUDIX family)
MGPKACREGNTGAEGRNPVVILACPGSHDDFVAAFASELRHLARQNAGQHAGADSAQHRKEEMEKNDDGWLQPLLSADDVAVQSLTTRRDICAVIFLCATEETLPWAQRQCQRLATLRPELFRVVFSQHASESSLVERYACCTEHEAHMVSHVPAHILKSLRPILSECGTGKLRCPICGKNGLTSEEMWRHAPQYHVGNKKGCSLADYPCPICGLTMSKEPLLPHIFESHAPTGSAHAAAAARKFVPYVAFGLCVIQRKSDGKFLVVQEYDNQGFWLPGGGIDPGEFPIVAARREALEEAGIDVSLTGLLRVECNTRSGSHVRMRYIFYGHPVDESEPVKTCPDFESVGACWVGMDDVLRNDAITWRSDEPLQWFSYIANGGAVFPIGILTPEGAQVSMLPAALQPSTGNGK